MSRRSSLPEGWRGISLYVDREHEARGVGGALFARIRSEVDSDATYLRGRLFDDDERSRVIVVDHYGFEVEQHSITSGMALPDAAPPRLPDGLTVESNPEMHFDDRDAVEAMLLASQTNPEAQRGLTFDLDKLAAFLGPGDVPITAIARVDGEPAGGVFGQVADGLLHVTYTGVDPSYRGRDLAFLLKQHAHHLAREAGAERVLTENEEHNTGIRHVNQRLGYRPVYGVFWLSRPLPGRAANGTAV
jgi:GNAT superfamily N-acetyltransferase